jgi:hypothetical protein
MSEYDNILPINLYFYLIHTVQLNRNGIMFKAVLIFLVNIFHN